MDSYFAKLLTEKTINEEMQAIERQGMDHDKDYPFQHRTKLYRDLQTLCSKIYLMHAITKHYD